jgi:hypothetical protein|tara:strand:- start:1192 stop:2919 length:1728 start_codon:yes stop_codon:yes gene_type:complete
MAYNTLCGTVNFCDDSGSIESMVDNYSNQTISGQKTFSSVLSASSISTNAGAITPPAVTSIAGDSAGRVLISNGDGTLYGNAALTFSSTSLTSSYFSGSAVGLTGLEIGGNNVNGELSASHLYLGDGMRSDSEKLSITAADGITVGASGVGVDLLSNGGLSFTGTEIRVNPYSGTGKASLSNADTFIISDSDSSNVTKKTTAAALATYMQNGLTFASPGGSDNQIQYRSSGNFAGNSSLTFDGTNTLTTVNITASGHVSSSFFMGDGSGLTNVNAALVPAGVNMNVQFNSGSTFSGSSNLNFNYAAATPVLQVTGDLSASNDFAVGRDSLFGRDTTVMRDVISYGNVSASLNISASNFYGAGRELTDLPIGNYTANRLVFCGAATNTLDAFNGLTWANPTLSVPGTVSATNISSSGGLNATSLGISGSATISGSLRARSLHTTIHNFNNAGTAGIFIPFLSTVEAAGPGYLQQYVVPAGGRLVKALVRTKTSQSDGAVHLDLFVGTNGTEDFNAGGSLIERSTVSMASANTTYTFAFSGSSPFDEGNIVGIEMTPAVGPSDVNVTCVWEYDFTNT